jgi:2,5-diketo-D-gluconate reductase B
MNGVYFEKSFERSFGTYPLKGEELAAALRVAVSVGYRSIDTAQMYGNEADIGALLSELSIRRTDLCITTKVHPDNVAESAFFSSIEKSLRDLRVDYVDVLALHWPPLDGGVAAPLGLLEKAQRIGYARAIAISNFTASMMRAALRAIETPLVANQVEFHPLLNQDALLTAAAETNIPLTSYCSLARGEIFKYPIFKEIGGAYGKSAAQVALRWILQQGVPINTMSTKPENIARNFDLMDFILSSIDMHRIGSMKAINYRVVDKTRVKWAPNWD